MSEDANENSDHYNPVFMDVGNESGNTSVAKQSANKQKLETAMTKNKQHRWNVCLLVAVAILFCLVLVLLGLVGYFIIVRRDLMSNVRSLENQLAETEHSLNATRIDLEAFNISEGSKSAQQQSEQES